MATESGVAATHLSWPNARLAGAEHHGRSFQMLADSDKPIEDRPLEGSTSNEDEDLPISEERIARLLEHGFPH
jgi:hypothetical protein